jgi:hypothetical protein
MKEIDEQRTLTPGATSLPSKRVGRRRLGVGQKQAQAVEDGKQAASPSAARPSTKSCMHKGVVRQSAPSERSAQPALGAR